jgi:4-oxalocrotonate tautomerase
MPFVHISIVEGRSAEQKRAVIRAVTDALVEHAGASRDIVNVVIAEYPSDHWAAGGVTYAERRATRNPSR